MLKDDSNNVELFLPMTNISSEVYCGIKLYDLNYLDSGDAVIKDDYR